MLLVGYLACSVKYMLFQPPIYHQNKGEGVRFYFSIATYIYLHYLHLLCVFVFICIYLCINTYKYTNNYKYTYKYINK